jgi:hypothetical protein
MSSPRKRGSCKDCDEIDGYRVIPKKDPRLRGNDEEEAGMTM